MQPRIVQLTWGLGLLLGGVVWAGPQPAVVGDHPAIGQEQQCVARCAEEAKLRISQCQLAGGADRDCLALGHEFQFACERECRSGKTCEERCERKAARVRRECLAAGGDEDGCNERAREVLEECLRENCPPPPSCETECERRAFEVLHECIEQGGSEDDCAMRARMFLRHCLAENCDLTLGCEERCKHEAKSVLQMCLEMGGSEDDCSARAHEYLKKCVAAHCPEPTCEERCVRRALAAYLECVEGGGAADACAHDAREFYNNCVKENCDNNLPCDERCRRFAAGVKRMCLDMGGSEDDCAARAQQALEHCLLLCPKPCGGIQGLGCPDGFFCHFPPGTCDIVDNMGLCELVPSVCPDVWQPVCGCDGETYRNRCEAIKAEVSIAHEGPCGAPRCGGPDSPPCEEGFYCSFPPGSCGDSNTDNTIGGVCRPLPDGCAGIYDPVCGCDGVTYSNSCVAAMHGQSIRHEGECEQRCGGIAGFPCDEGEFCHFPPGTCHIVDNMGVCETIPTACPDVWEPVCGCDGKTYGNRCEAAMAGVSIDHEGECDAQRCGSPDLPQCPDGSFCHFPAGTCGAVNAGGTCEEVPEACPTIFDPVCGCDGVTYANRCEAARAKQSIKHEGSCEGNWCDPGAGVTCGEGEFCKYPPGACHCHDCACCDVVGECTQIPLGCPDNVDPVCGCDGKTYFNPCEAAAAGVSLAYPGPCAEACDSNHDCGDRHYCHKRLGECDSATPGMCAPRPQFCPEYYQPVCGCDGRTYANICFAAGAGVSVAYEGGCKD